jgi:hypothetical protein
MTKSDSSLEEIDLSRVTTRTSDITINETQAVNAFDTETADGRIFMLSYCFQDESGVIDNPYNFVRPDKIWNILTHYKCRNAQNMWFNLSFDADVLLSSVLSPKEISKLSVTGKIESKGKEIIYIPGKFLKIKDENRHTYTHYDAQQFFYDNLDNAAKEWLDKGKTGGIKTEKFGRNGLELNEYIKENYKTIKIYAEKDAKLTRNLWLKLRQKATNLDIPINKPISTGYLAQEWLDYHLPHRPGFGPKQMGSMAWNSYAGGRFEIYERGKIGNVIGVDINSAYPNILSQLPDPSTLKWQRYDNPSYDKIKQADYGFVRVNVTTDKSKRIQPFAIKLNDVVKYPAMRDKTITVVKDIYTFAKENGYLVEDTVKEVWLGNETKGTKFLFTDIPELYADRKIAESKGKMKKGLLLKIILNSMYGKFCQTTPKRKSLKEKKELSNSEKIVPSISLPKRIKKELQEEIVENLEAGPYFNPFIASYITGKTRLQLHKAVEESGLVEHTIMLATDCIMVRKQPFEDSNFELVDETEGYEKQLGEWEKEYAGSGYVIGAGVYEIQKPDGFKTKTRGFREKDIQEKSLVKEVKEKGGIMANVERPMSLKEAVWSGEEISDIGAFDNSERTINPNMDEKREWEDELTWEKFISETQESKPILLIEDNGTDSIESNTAIAD